MPRKITHKPAIRLLPANKQHLARRNGGIAPLVATATLIVLLLLGAVYYFGSGDAGQTSAIEPLLTSVTRGEFVSQVIDQGEIRSSENVEIRCEVEARNGDVTVLSVVPEGSLVEPGDFLVQLNAASFEKELEQQKIAMANAETAKIQSGNFAGLGPGGVE